MSFYQRILGHPFVYNKIRPLVVGIDMSPVYKKLEVSNDDILVDVGCGTGDALNYLTGFRAYHGFDTDGTAIAFARERARTQANVHFSDGLLSQDDLTHIQPTRLLMYGLLHHLSDDDAVGLLKMCGATPSIKRIVTQDVVFLSGEFINNVLAKLDRGRHVRTLDGYRQLVQRSGLRMVNEEVVQSHPSRGLAKYLVMILERGRDQSA
jgi:SAM-dependent methyltransferase